MFISKDLQMSFTSDEKKDKLTYEKWDVLHLCFEPPQDSFAIIILNQALNKKFSGHVAQLWKKAAFRICVDGGTNEFYSFIHRKDLGNGLSCNDANIEDNCKKCSNQESRNEGDSTYHNIPLPHIICGDFDSIEPSIYNFYANAGVKIIPTMNQDQTDFTKALYLLSDHLSLSEMQVSQINVIAGLGGSRFDHVLGLINTLYKVYKTIPHQTILMADHTLLWLLDAGSHRITIPQEILEQNEERSWCALASFSETAIVSTSGLKYDMDKRALAFGPFTSTSNTFATDGDGLVEIHTSRPVLWMMGWETPDTSP